MTRLYLFLIVIPFSPCLFAQDGDSKEIEGINYSISYPQNWKLDQSGTMGSSFTIFCPETSDPNVFRNNVNLIIQDLSDCYNINLDQYVHIYRKLIKILYQDSSVLEIKHIARGRSEFQRIIYSGDQGVYHLMFLQSFMIRDDKAYILTLTCEKDNFEKYKKTGEAIMNSFVLK